MIYSPVIINKHCRFQHQKQQQTEDTGPEQQGERYDDTVHLFHPEHHFLGKNTTADKRRTKDERVYQCDTDEPCDEILQYKADGQTQKKTGNLRNQKNSGINEKVG